MRNRPLLPLRPTPSSCRRNSHSCAAYGPRPPARRIPPPHYTWSSPSHSFPFQTNLRRVKQIFQESSKFHTLRAIPSHKERSSGKFQPKILISHTFARRFLYFHCHVIILHCHVIGFHRPTVIMASLWRHYGHK